MNRAQAEAVVHEYIMRAVMHFQGKSMADARDLALSALASISDSALEQMNETAFTAGIFALIDAEINKQIAEFLWQYNACAQEMNLYLLHRLISEAKSRSKAESLTIIGQSHHLDKLRVQLVGVPRDQWEDSEFTNPMKRVHTWIESLDMPADEVRIETPAGVCRLYNLCCSF